MSVLGKSSQNWKKRLQNDLSSVDGDVKPQFKQTKVPYGHRSCEFPGDFASGEFPADFASGDFPADFASCQFPGDFYSRNNLQIRFRLATQMSSLRTVSYKFHGDFR